MTLAGRIVSVIRLLLELAAAVVLGAALAGVLWLSLLGKPPPAPPLPAEAGRLPEPEYAVTFVPGIGPRTVGACVRVLAIDGGGVRGLVPALLLAEIERLTGTPIYRQFDLVAGTSTGAVLALGLTRPSNADARRPAYTAADLVELYRRHAAEIFPDAHSLLHQLQRIIRPKFTSAGIEAVYRTYFEDVRLKEALTNVAVPAYDIEEGRRLWFVSHRTSHGDLLLGDIARGATAAPTYLPPVRFAVQRNVSGKGYVALVDGALFANNPAQEALRLGQAIRRSADTTVLLASLGTGGVRQARKFEDAWGWGVLGWTDPLLEIAFSDPAIDDELKRTLQGNDSYFRLQPELTAPVALDDSSPAALAQLESAARRYIDGHRDALQHLARELALPRGGRCGMPIGADYERPDGPRQRANAG